MKEFRYDQWLTETRVPVGFEFKQADYAILDGLSSTSDATAATLIQWDLDTANYVSTVERKIVLDAGEGASLNLTIRVMPSAARAKESLVVAYESSSLLPPTIRYAGDFGYAIGAAALFRGVALGATEVTDTDVHGLVFVRYNIVVDLSSDPACEVILPTLAYALDEQIKTQALADASKLRPTVSVTLTQTEVDTTGWKTGQKAEVAVSHEISGFPDGTAYGKHFYSGGVTSHAYDAKGRIVGAPGEPPYWGSGSGLSFDDAANPTKVIVQGAGSRGKYKIGMIGWGPNLLPKIDTKNLEVS